MAKRKTLKASTLDVEQLGLHWDTRLHMAVLQVVDEWKTFRSQVQGTKPLEVPKVNAHTEPDVKRTWIVSLKGRSVVHATLSPSHSIELQAGNYSSKSRKTTQ